MENNEIAIINPNEKKLNRFEVDGFNVVADLTTASEQYCSLQAVSDEDKINLYNAVNNPENRLSDCINKVISIKDVYIEVVNCTNEETGEITACPRIIFFDDKTSYQCVSIGIYSAVKKIFQWMGTPENWEKPVKVEVKQITKGTRKMLTLNMVK